MPPARIRRVRRAGAATGCAFALLLTSGSVAFADTSPADEPLLAAADEPGDTSPWEPPPPDSAAYPGRVVEVTGDVALEPAVPGGEIEPEANSPLGQDDVVITGEGAAATLELPAGWAIRVGANSRVRRWLDNGAQVIGLEAGTLVACAARDAAAAFIVTQHASTWLAPGTTVRAAVTAKGTELDVRGGRIEVTAPAGRRVVDAGRGVTAWADSTRRPRVRYLRNGWDALDASADVACAALGRDAGLGDLRLVGAGSLVDHGSWVAAAGQSFWCPRVASDWSPFSNGCFRHDPRWGWGFIPHEPWGFVTHHHGYWVRLPDCGWAWSPGDLWHPHLVTFWTVGPDVYWCPRRPPPSCPVPGPGSGGSAGPGPGDRPWREHATGAASLDRFRRRIVRATPVPADGDGAVLRPTEADDRVGVGVRPTPRARLTGRLRPVEDAPAPDARPAAPSPPAGLGNDLRQPPRDGRVHERTFVRPAAPGGVRPEAPSEVPSAEPPPRFSPTPLPERLPRITLPTGEGVRVLQPPSQPSARVLARPPVPEGRPAARFGTGEVTRVPAVPPATMPPTRGPGPQPLPVPTPPPAPGPGVQPTPPPVPAPVPPVVPPAPAPQNRFKTKRGSG